MDLLFDAEELSDAPSNLDQMDLDIEAGTDNMALTTPLGRGVDGDMIPAPNLYSKFEEIPTEMLNQIVSYLPDDDDLSGLALSCRSFASLASEKSAVWRERFLSRYDFPNISDMTEFAWAWKIRRLVLCRFVAFIDPKDERLLLQLETLRDMILESFNPPRSHLPPPLMSKNLLAIASPHNSPWIRIFLSCFLYPCRGQRYGQPHPFFDTLQLVFSHLLLSPVSNVVHLVRSSRANYDMALVYAWEKPLIPLYHRVPEIAVSSEEAQLEPANRRIRRKSKRSKFVRPQYVLETHDLLHIRNFWHRHLIEEQPGFTFADIAENTYGRMAQDLARTGLAPKQWEKPLKNNDLQIATEWYGHYSTLAQWPKKKQELEEVQSLAADWNKVDPLKLDFDISHNNAEDGFWPPIFRDIPAFEKTIPALQSGSCVFIRGLAPFVELAPRISERQTSTSTASQATLSTPTAHQLPKYHPYLAMRLRGVIHSIPSQPQPTEATPDDQSIPGWNRVVFVLYKPAKRHLIQVLEHAEEDFGSSFGTAITAQMMQNGTASPQLAQILNGVAPATGQPLDLNELDAHLDQHLRDKLLAGDLWRDGSKLGKDAIEEMEEKYRLSEYLDWNDIDFAYAYEGAVLPGGKIMMGRWWRLAMGGEGDASEWNDALGMEIDEDENVMDVDGDVGAAAGNGNGNNHIKVERGPFVFWC